MKRIQDKITELSKKPSTNADTIAVLRMCQKRIEQLEQSATSESFEEWALSAGFNIKLAYDGTYLIPVTQAAFMGWMARGDK